MLAELHPESNTDPAVLGGLIAMICRHDAPPRLYHHAAHVNNSDIEGQDGSGIVTGQHLRDERERHPSLAGLLLDISHPKAPIADKRAIAIARDHYGLDVVVRRLATEKDDTFLVTATSGARFILKIAHPMEPLPELDLQVAVLRHLENRFPGIPVPRILPNTSGSFMTPTGDELSLIHI